MTVLTLKEAKERGLVETLNKQHSEMDFIVRVKNALENTFGPLRAWELVEKNEGNLRQRKNIGNKAIEDIKNVLSDLGLQLDTRLTDALKRELDAPIMHDDPHEDVEPTTGPATMPDHITSLDGLQLKLDVINKPVAF